MFIVTRKIKDEKWNCYDYICLVIMILFSALRYGIGTDYNLYSDMFDAMTDIHNIGISRTGIGFSFLMLLVKSMHIPFQCVIIILSVFTNIFYYIFVKKYCKNPGLAIFLYIALGFYTMSFNMFRQMLSMVLVLYAVKLANEKKITKSIIIAIIAISMHSSSIIALAFYLFFYELKNKVSYSIICLSSILMVIFYDFVFIYIMPLFSQYSLYMNEQYAAGTGTKLIVIFYIFVISMIAYYRNELVKFNKNNFYFINIIIFSLIFVIMELKHYLFARLAYYFTILVPLVLADLYNVLGIKNKKLDWLFFYSVMFIYFLMYIYSFDEVIPYQCIFFK